MRLIVKAAELQYGGKTYLRGQTFHTESDKHAKLLNLIGKTEPAPSMIPKAKELEPESIPDKLEPESIPDKLEPEATLEPPVAEPSTKPAPRTGRYRRRDLRAENS